MSISENVGGVSKYLNNIRTATGYLDLKEGIYNALKRNQVATVLLTVSAGPRAALKTAGDPRRCF